MTSSQTSPSQNQRPPPILTTEGPHASSKQGEIYPKSSSPDSSSTSFTPRRDSTLPSPSISHRSSFVEQQRVYPPSPRARRQPSFSGAALAELIMQPAQRSGVTGEERFHGRDWRTIQVHEIIDATETRFVQLDTSVEETTKILVKSGAPNVVLIRESHQTNTAIGTFDYSDLNAYLLIVLGLVQPDSSAIQLSERARHGEAIPLRDLLDHLGTRERPIFVTQSTTLTLAMEILGSGSHRVIACKEGSSEAIGVLTQLRLVRFFWENHQNFEVLEKLYAKSLMDLGVSTKNVLAINGDLPVADALRLMHDQGVTSLPVLDNHRNVVGNISHVDVRLLTDTSSIPLLSSTCIHFISIILSERGMIDGKDSYPVFHVTPYSTLAHSVAKLCATRSHRMWIVDSPSPAVSVPPSPGIHAPVPSVVNSLHARHNSLHEPTAGPPYTSTNTAVSISASQLPGAGMSGRLSGVISLTDVLNLLARASGLDPSDPDDVRQRRRRSSSSSSRPTTDGLRASADIIRGSTELRRTPSASSRRGT